MLRVPRVVKEFASHFADGGFQCYLVGGAVRDTLLGRRGYQDYDIATDALPEEVSRIFRRVIPTGIKHGTVTVLFKGTRFEVTTYRIDQEYRDGRRPDSVVFTPSIEEDLKRRDFTINAIAFDLQAQQLLDPHGGREDLAAGIIRAIGDPLERFREDGLRPLRACRFAAQFSFSIEVKTFSSIRLCLDTVKLVSAERIRDELVRLLEAEKPSGGFQLMKACGLLELIIPELTRCEGVAQGELHSYDVYEHLLYSCDAAPRGNLAVRLAALFHDLGKPKKMQTDTASATLSFHRHEQLSAELAEQVMRRLRFANPMIKRVSHLVAQHMFLDDEKWSDAAVRRFIARVGQEHLADILSLRRADQLAMAGKYLLSASLIALEKRIDEILAGEKALSLKDLAVNGNDIIRELGIDPGPQVGIILSALFESVLEDPGLNRRERLLRIARDFYRSRLARR